MKSFAGLVSDNRTYSFQRSVDNGSPQTKPTSYIIVKFQVWWFSQRPQSSVYEFQLSL